MKSHIVAHAGFEDVDSAARMTGPRALRDSTPGAKAEMEPLAQFVHDPMTGPSGDRPDRQRMSRRGAPAHRVNRILVVDDNDDALQTVRLLLEPEGYDLQVAPNGPTALDIADWFVPEVVLLDLGLPGMDGFEVAARMLVEPVLVHVILIALTGYGQPRDRERALACGFRQHLVKPVNPSALMQLLASL